MPLVKILYVNVSWPNDCYDAIYHIGADTPWQEVSEDDEATLLNHSHLIPTGKYDKAVLVKADDSVETTVGAVKQRIEAIEAANAKREATRKAKEKERAKAKAARDAERKRKQLEKLKQELGEA